jgi:peptide deformylase
MSNFEIKKYPDSVLKKRAEEVKEITPEIKELIYKMKKIVEEDEITVGLAAPQIGISKRIIVVQTDKGPAAFINPEIIEKTKETETMEEGCLSLPGIFLDIKRWKGIKVKALDEKGEEVELQVTGFMARVFQQEIDHLNGILIIDRIPFWKKLWLWLKI